MDVTNISVFRKVILLLLFFFTLNANAAILPEAVFQHIQNSAPEILQKAQKENPKRFNLSHFDNTLDAVLTYIAKQDYQWRCDIVKQDNLDPKHETGVIWSTLSCSGIYPHYVPFKAGKPTGKLRINIVDIDLSDPHIQINPVLAKKNTPNNQPYTETVLAMGLDKSQRIAGVNGGYFFINTKGFFDSNCPWKSYPQVTFDQVGDGLLMIDGVTYSENCAVFKTTGPARSALLQNTNGEFVIQAVDPNTQPDNTRHALGSGPGLINQVNGKSDIQIEWQGILSTFEFSANTAIALAEDATGQQHMMFFSVNGFDKTAGMFSFDMANFLYTAVPQYLGLSMQQAMSMDQGKSTTMFIKDDQGGRIVSQSSHSGSTRAVYNALFVELTEDALS